MKDVVINGTNISTLGATLLLGSYAELLTPPPVKDYISNDDVTKDGLQVLTTKGDGTSATLIKDRDLTLTFLIKGADKTDFLSKYKAFTELISNGLITLYVPELVCNFHLVYRNCTTFDNFRLHACKIAVKFQEPDPTNRA